MRHDCDMHQSFKYMIQMYLHYSAYTYRGMSIYIIHALNSTSIHHGFLCTIFIMIFVYQSLEAS